ncbi:NAD(P)/FAD-dependent oxidoreductase [Alkaliphilus pronyensis]|uniref:NAD(P)/FAD-dependent oxidoreductase n=1 Tax=Alkaliphilus pronyensis TaxID=1482732 RepID=A0A6I0FBK7_9FIRM|nr:NAD(P)/FAD-dependent oxidoreductase [Alkaliphilus pronyensis]KAB3537722.1 NAD(P)/FAD-dependent oxidoreductase [Alkaliphilus pronyensis]
MKVDVAVIGAGVIGTYIARELARYNLNIVIIEKENDVANGTTKANSAIIHAGYDAKTGSLKAKTNVLGNRLQEELCRELEVPFERIGSFVVAFNDEEVEILKKLEEQGNNNGVPGLKILNQAELREMEPNLSEEVVAALYAPTAGIIGPFELAIALAENAADNGVEILLNSKVTSIDKSNNKYIIKAGSHKIETKYVINCAGLYADEINNMVNRPYFEIVPNRGQYHLFDKTAGDFVNKVVFQCPTKAGKGVLVLPTVHGNVLIGPTAENTGNKEANETTTEGFTFLREKAEKVVKSFPYYKVITSFSGLRAKTPTGDFIIEEVQESRGFINVAAIDSPGLSAAPAIGNYAIDILKTSAGAFEENKSFNPKRKAFKPFTELSMEEKQQLIDQDPRYGRVICRCEQITEGEIVDVIKRKAGALTLDAVKRRARAGMGRCQGGFCGPRVMEIIARELNIDITDVVKDGIDSYILTGATKTIYDDTENLAAATKED